MSKKWDPKSGTVLLLHYKPKDFQGKNPLGSQIAQFVVHEKDKEESLAKTYMDAARKGMVEIGQRIIDGHLAPEKANEEKKKRSTTRPTGASSASWTRRPRPSQPRKNLRRRFPVMSRTTATTRRKRARRKRKTTSRAIGTSSRSLIQNR